MSKSLRRSEQWFRRGLWLVALAFAWFLIGLGSTVVGDLPKVEQQLSLEDFMDAAAAERLRESMKAQERIGEESKNALAQAQLLLRSAQADAAAARDNFRAWVATRSATQRSEQDPQVIERTRELERWNTLVRQAQAQVEVQEKLALDARQRLERERAALQAMESQAAERMQAELRKVELRVFVYRLALTLPLLVLALWLFVKKRSGTYWPFVWGFIFFAGFAFFVELVPYLPSYGGYVRYAVGIVLTAVIGRYAIVALNRYLEKQKLAEQQPEAARREELSDDTALARLSKGVCPGCERPVDLKNENINFCPHCGISLHDHCQACGARKSTFAKFCHACGASALKG